MTAKILRESNNLVNLTLRTFGNSQEEGSQIIDALSATVSSKL